MDESAHRNVRHTAEMASPTASPSAASVWLCAPRPHHDDPDLAVWASRTIAEFSRPGERVIIRAIGTYPGLPGEAATLIAAAHRTGRSAHAVLPTPAAAARTRTLLPALLPTAAPVPGAPSAAAVGIRAQPVSAWLGPRIGVGRRRPASEAGPAGLVVVLAGPVVPGARPPRRRITDRLIGVWAQPLRPGGLLVILRPAEVGTARADSHAALVTAGYSAGLSYCQHLVLVHTPTTPDGLAQPEHNRSAHAPFWPVHTDAFVFVHPADPSPHPGEAALAAPPDPPPIRLGATRPDDAASRAGVRE